MAYNNSDEIFITMHKDDPEAFYAKIPYDKLDNIHRIGGKWMQSGKEWRFPLDDEIWGKFQKEFADEFANGKVHKDLAFLLAFDKRHKDLDKFLKFKEVALRDEPTDFGVDGVSLNGKNCLFNYQRWGVQCGLTVGDGFLIGDQPGLGKGLLPETGVCTPEGMRMIGELKVGDKVIGSHGVAVTVTGVFPQPRQQVYEFTFTDGFTVTCDASHLWTVMEGNSSKKKTYSTKEILENGYLNEDGTPKYHVPLLTDPVQFERPMEKSSLDPHFDETYIVGMTLAKVNKTQEDVE